MKVEKQQYYCYYCMNTCDSSRISGEPLCPDCGGRMELKISAQDVADDNKGGVRIKKTSVSGRDLLRDMDLEDDVLFEIPEQEHTSETEKRQYQEEEIQPGSETCRHCRGILHEDVHRREPDKAATAEPPAHHKSSSWFIRFIMVLSFGGTLLTAVYVTAYYCPRLPSYQEIKNIVLPLLNNIF